MNECSVAGSNILWEKLGLFIGASEGAVWNWGSNEGGGGAPIPFP